MEHFDWRKSSGYDAIFTSLGGEYSISGLGYKATPPLPSRQIKMAAFAE